MRIDEMAKSTYLSVFGQFFDEFKFIPVNKSDLNGIRWKALSLRPDISKQITATEHFKTIIAVGVEI